MKVLMISPGPFSETTSGLGLAADRLGIALSNKVSLTVIQPESVQPTEKQPAGKKAFEDTSVVKDITRIQVSGNISPYLYSAPQSEMPSEEYVSSVKSELMVFTEEVIEAGTNQDFDVIYAHDWVTIDAALALKRQTNKPLVLHMHSLDVDRIASNNHSWIFDLEKTGMESADKIVAVSNYTADRIQEFYDIPSAKIKVVYNGCEPLPTNGHTSVFSDPVVLYVGRLSGQKSPQAFVEIADRLLRQKPEVRFVMAGTGSMKENLIETAAHRGIGDRIHFTGYLDREALGKIYAGATIFCMPSLSEPFGLAAVEAAAAGLPLVISSNSGAAEVLPGAITCDPHEMDMFVQKLADVIDQKVDLKKLVKQNEEAVADLTWENSASKVHELFTHMVA